MTKTLLGLLLLIFSSGQALAEGISVSQSLDRTDMAFSDTVKFEITLRWDGPQTAYFFDKPLNPYIESLKIRRFASSIGSSLAGEKEVTTKKFLYVLEPTMSGIGRIEPIEISYVTWPDSIPGQLMTEAMAVNIAPPKAVESSQPSYWWLWTLLGVALVGAMAAVVASVARKRRRPVEVVKTPRDIVLEELASARSAAGTDLKKFQTEVYKVLTAFLKRTYNVDPAEFAGEELEPGLVKSGMDHGAARKISEWLVRAEKDKYSPLAAGPGEAVRLESEMREFFEKMQM